jgi:hypothetical protein
MGNDICVCNTPRKPEDGTNVDDVADDNNAYELEDVNSNVITKPIITIQKWEDLDGITLTKDTVVSITVKNKELCAGPALSPYNIMITSLILKLDNAFDEASSDSINWEGLASFTNLLSLTIDKKNWGDLPDKALENLTANLKTLTNLQALKLDFYGCNGFTASGATWNFNEALSKLTGLKSLDFNFGNCQKVTDSEVMKLCDTISKLTLLNSLTLSFKGMKQVSDVGLAEISSCLSKLKDLKGIDLAFIVCNGITDTGLGVLTQSLNGKPLKKLSLDFQGCLKLTVTGLTALSETLKQSTQLTKFALTLGGHDGLVEYERNTSARFKDKELLPLFKSFSKLTSLNSLKLRFALMPAVNESNLIELIKNLTFLKKLQRLALEFESCDSPLDRGLLSLGDTLAAFSNLKSLELGFYSCANVNMRGISGLCGNIGNLQKLNRLKLAVAKMQDSINDDALEKLAVCLRGLYKLGSLHLDFTGANVISDKGVRKLRVQLAKLKNIKSLEVILPENNLQISQEEKTEMFILNR